MNKIKIVFLIVLITLVSGCKIRSNVNVLLDGKVTENVTITESKEGLNLSNKGYSNYIDGELKNFKTLIKYGNYDYKQINDKNNFGVQFEKKYDSICSYFQDTLFNQYIYKHISCKENDGFIIIENDTPILERYDEEGYSNPIDLSDVQLSISLPIRAAESNADNENKNTYTWNFDNTPSGKNIYLKINKEEMKQANIDNQRELQKNKILKVVMVIIILIGIFSSLGFVGLKLYKKYKENKLEY